MFQKVGILQFWGHFYYINFLSFRVESGLRIAYFSSIRPREHFCRFLSFGVSTREEDTYFGRILQFWGHYYNKNFFSFRVESGLRIAHFSSIHPREHFCRFLSFGVSTREKDTFFGQILQFWGHFYYKNFLSFRVESGLRISKFASICLEEHLSFGRSKPEGSINQLGKTANNDLPPLYNICVAHISQPINN